MAIPEDEAAASGAERAQSQNPIPNGNPNQNPNSNPYPNPNSNQNPNPNSPHSTKGSIGKSCKGCTYYSSTYKTKSKYPTCVGISKTLQGHSLLVYNSFFFASLVRFLKKTPPFILGEADLAAMKEGCSLANFKYACIGYSVYLDDKDSSADLQDKKAKLPLCFGLQVFVKPKGAVGHDKTEDEHGTLKP
ncbi:uncharacterized protein LOC106777728 isoform X2 [Vigna radiata var. radiata]|uniref:Uncharacterized protein LOC106777728 isoform X2 n=1 Tax=Vigna radiata var. radiata TaxID=3916 RepID=A0A1S3VSB2_VIGRR|nr:uncharacterized protein LOC106777728 isoform X2 [Vigna radiata var. radiata]